MNLNPEQNNIKINSKPENINNKFNNFLDLKIVEVPNELEGLSIIERNKKNRENREKIESSEYKEKLKILAEKYKKGDVFDFHLEKKEKTNIYNIILEDICVGSFGLRDKGDVKQIAAIQIRSEFQNKGLGKDLYVKLNNYFNKLDGSVLASDENKTSDLADNLWNSLLRDGLAEKGEVYISGKNEIRFKK